MKNNKIQISKDAKFLFYKDKVIATNRCLGNWMKITRECYSFLLEAIQQKLTYHDFIAQFEDSNREYVSRLVDNLIKIHVLETKLTSDVPPTKVDSASIMITERCNLFCKHCSVVPSNLIEEEYFGTDQMKTNLDKIIQLSPKRIVLTGGEPLVRKDFLELLEYLRTNYNGLINLMTNATLFNKENVNEITQNVDTIHISIDGIDEETCSAIRGHGVFDLVTENIKLIQKSGFENITLSMVDYLDDRDVCIKFYDFCEAINVKPMIRRLSYIGNAYENKDYIQEQKNNYKGTSSNSSLAIPTQKHERESLKACCCNAGIDNLDIDAQGNIYGCTVFSSHLDAIGNIMDTADLTSLIDDDSKFVQEFEKYTPYKIDIDACKICPVSYFCWTCPFVAYELIKENSFEDFCKTRKIYLMHLLWGEICDE